MNTPYHSLGVDVGSTTAKTVLLDPAGEVVASAYRRHNAETLQTLQALIAEARQEAGDVEVDLLITGSAGLGLSEKFNFPFIQEIIASAEVVRQLYPQVTTLMDIGGEDAKLIFFDPNEGSAGVNPGGSVAGAPDIRMNGACAGGTGAYLDQMATLLNVPVSELNAMAARSQKIHPIASRCGVFAKTDVQNLLSQDAAREDIAASIFHAVVLQTLATLARGHPITPVVMFVGGPLTFLPELKSAFIQSLELLPEDWLEVERAELIPARGAALAACSRQEASPRSGAGNPGRGNGHSATYTLSGLLEALSAAPQAEGVDGRLKPLFQGAPHFQAWETERSGSKVECVDLQDAAGEECFLGVDSGSTTTKLVLVDRGGRLFFDDYRPNNGNAIRAFREGLERMRAAFAGLAQPPRIVRSAVTGYGEDLIRLAYGLDDGMVETLAHYRAARAFDPQVSFILDIGGQDMKAIFVRDGHIQRIEINEACSSGCGTFIEAFARSLGRSVADFAAEACQSEAPCDLGTRCTVFMNSRVKQALREGAGVGDISAGLAYSVIKNALHKVLKLTDVSILGDHIVVQGGSFRNPAIHRALEHILEKPVVCPDKAELMGAYGAALAARDTYLRVGVGVGIGVPLDALDTVGNYQKRSLNCRGCENRCSVTKLIFPNQNVFYTGNRCERTFSNRGLQRQKGANVYASKLDLLFDRPTWRGEDSSVVEAPPALTIGIPRALNFYENYPFWCTLFVECGFKVRLSDVSSSALFEKGAGTVMSENICFPAKLLHGHIFNLIQAGVDRIFYPMVFYEQREFGDSINSFNCPIVSGYPDVVRSAIDPQRRHGVPFDQPAVTFSDPKLLKQSCGEYLEGLGVEKRLFERAFDLALTAQAQYKADVRSLGAEVLERAGAEGRKVVVLAGHPYHLDPLINHKIPTALADMGVDVLTEDSVPLETGQSLHNPLVLTQWEYLNRFFHAARFVGRHPELEMAQLNSFGCGPDAFALDEVKGILSEYGKNHTVIRIDEIDSLGSARLRLRSMLEAREEGEAVSQAEAIPLEWAGPWRGDLPACPGDTCAVAESQVARSRRSARVTTRLYRRSDRRRVVLVPEFSRFCTPPIVRPVMDQGYRIDILPPSNQESVQVGLKYTNNEICYPGIIVIGDVIKALQSGRYDPADVIAGSWETGGQCRASNISCLLKKALVAAHYEDVPVVTLSTKLKSFNPQPEFKLNIVQYLYKALLGMVYTDGLSAMYHASAAREPHKGPAQALADKYMAPFEDGSMPITRAMVVEKLRQAVAEFNRLEADPTHRPQVGIVGEIYVKYNTFVNNGLVSWLMDQGLEVVLPPLLSFFLGAFVGFKAAVQERIRRPDLLSHLTAGTQGFVQGMVDQAETVLRDFRYYHPRHAIQSVADTARSVVHLTHQYGEGWLLSGEIGEYVKAGVRNIICLQPFGCIANHVVAKGVARRLKETYRDLNLLFLDLDAGISEVNFLNRLHFFVEQAREG